MNGRRTSSRHVAVVFWSFRIMVGIGFAMVGLGLWSLWLRWRRRLYDAGWMHRAGAGHGPIGGRHCQLIALPGVRSRQLQLIDGRTERGLARSPPAPAER